jgi:hypothetical protein
MNGFVIATSVAAAVLAPPWFLRGHGFGTPPKPFDDNVSLPGKIPASATSLKGAWQFGYQLLDANMEGRKSDLIVGTSLFLREDGTYTLSYHARWNLPRPPVPVAGGGTVPTSTKGGMDGRNVSETGHFSLSGEVLLLEPENVDFSNLENNTVINRETIANDNHTLFVRLDKGHLAVAGRCASYQVDPICRDTPIVWYTMNAQIGGRWLGREPKARSP